MAKTPTPARTPAPRASQPAAGQTPHQEDAKVESDAQGAEPALGTIPARILVDHGEHKCNTLSLLTEDEAENCADWADTSRAAVEYAASITPPEDLERLKALASAAAADSDD